MSSDTPPAVKDLNLTQFACRVLKDQGAILETEARITQALLPRELSAALAVEEYISLATDPEDNEPSEGSPLYSLSFQSPLLDKIIRLAGTTLPFSRLP